MSATELIDTIKALADAPCQCALAGLQPLSTCVCNGTGRHPLTKSLRVECVHGHSVNPKHWADEKKHRADCPGFRAATPQEAERLLAEMLQMAASEGFADEIEFHVEGDEGGTPHFICGLPAVRDYPIGTSASSYADAFYMALAAALGVEVEPDVSSRP